MCSRPENSVKRSKKARDRINQTGFVPKNNMMYFFVSAGGASEGNLSNFCNIPLQNAMKRCSREYGFELVLKVRLQTGALFFHVEDP